MSSTDGTNMSGLQEKGGTQISVQKATGTAIFPIDLVPSKIAHVKPTADTVKVASVVQAASQQGTTSFRTIGGGQTSQVRVVVPSLMSQPIIKQIEGNPGGVRTQITAIPSRTLSQTSITVTRSVTPTTYLPRAGVTAVTSIQTQRLGAPIRTPPPAVAGLSTNFVRGTAVARNSSSPATTAMSPTTATWMGPVHLIKAINPNPTRQRLVTQNISNAPGSANVVTVGQASNLATVQTQQQNQGNLQSVASQGAQQTLVATLALPRQQTATLVYSHVSGTQGQSQQYNPSSPAQRFTVAASLAGGQRQMRPIQLGNRTFSTAKIGVGNMNTTSISIRAPNLPVLTQTIPAAGPTGTIQARTTSANINLSTTSLSTARIIQIPQQQSGTGAPQLISSSGRITNNLMLQPIIMNPSGSGKIGIRQPTTIATKVQPSLTITQLGVGKLAPTQQTSNAPTLTASNMGSIISHSSANTSNVTTVTGNIVHQQQSQQVASQSTNISVANTQQPITQIVSAATGQIIAAQSVNVNVPASPTVVPLAITSRATNILTGTITPIKSSPAVSTTISVPPIAKVIPQQQHHQQQQQQSQQQQQAQQQQQQQESSQATQQGGQNTGLITSTQQTQQIQPTSVFIHARPSGSNTTGSATVIPSGGAFLPASGTFYYESVPASSISSTGVLSLTTTTITSSISSSQTVTSTNLSSGLSSSLAYTPTQGTFTVVPSASNRTVNQIHIPSSTTSGSAQGLSQIHTVRFTHHVQDQGISGSTNQVTINQQQQQAAQQQVQSTAQPTQHQIITMAQASQGSSQSNQGIQQTHMLIPVQTSTKLLSSAIPSSSPRTTNVSTAALSAIGATTFLRKRDSDGSPIRAAKNLAPTLLSMGSAQISNIITERTKDRDRDRERERATSPNSSGGSTTVSANSSPGVDQQMREEINSMLPMNVRMNESHFNPIDEMYPGHQSTNVQQAVRVQAQHHTTNQPLVTTTNGNLESTPKKKARRAIDTSQQQITSNLIQTLNRSQPQAATTNNTNQQPQSTINHEVLVKVNNSNSGNSNSVNNSNNVIVNNNSSNTNPVNNTNINNNNISSSNSTLNNNNTINNNTIQSSNKENTKPVEIIIKKPRPCNLLDTYKQNWKPANNHFQRYSDVKPREERRPTVMDLANQSHVAQKINGWKIHHLSSQMEDLCEIESQAYDKLNAMLKLIESHGQTPDTDRVNDLIKGNMQRSKIIVDGVNEARTQIMKIFEHKAHVSDIIHRCASKRNYKKREKT